jgi:hypothetical protein
MIAERAEQTIKDMAKVTFNVIEHQKQQQGQTSEQEAKFSAYESVSMATSIKKDSKRLVTFSTSLDGTVTFNI